MRVRVCMYLTARVCASEKSLYLFSPHSYDNNDNDVNDNNNK